jgi:hypothetical protein
MILREVSFGRHAGAFSIEPATIAPLRLGRLPGDMSWSVFILESRHTRTADQPGKASPGHAMGEQCAKLTRAVNAERWPEQLET